MTQSNFPPPSGVADEIIVEAIKCLDAGEWDELTDDSVTVRTVRILHEHVTIVNPLTDVDMLKYGRPSVAYRDAFREAFKKAVEREKDRLMAPLRAAMEDSAVKARADAERRNGLLQIASVVVALGFVAWGVVSISSCSTEAARREEARNQEVNKYGYKRGAIASRKTWPDDCASSGYIYQGRPENHYTFDSIYECKRIWEDWESRAEIWVDWKEAP